MRKKKKKRKKKTVCKDNRLECIYLSSSSFLFLQVCIILDRRINSRVKLDVLPTLRAEIQNTEETSDREPWQQAKGPDPRSKSRPDARPLFLSPRLLRPASCCCCSLCPPTPPKNNPHELLTTFFLSNPLKFPPALNYHTLVAPKTFYNLSHA